LMKEWAAKSKKSIAHYGSLGEFVNSFEAKPVITQEAIKKEVAPSLEYLSRPFYIDANSFAGFTAGMNAASASALSVLNSAGGVIGNPQYYTHLGGLVTDAAATYDGLTLPIAHLAATTAETQHVITSILANAVTAYSPLTLSKPAATGAIKAAPKPAPAKAPEEKKPEKPEEPQSES